MKLSNILSLIPPRIREPVTSHIFLRQYDKHRSLYRASKLEFCPHIRMFDLIPGDTISDNIAFNGFYELELSREIAKLSRKGNVLVDVGANMGYFSLLWAGLNPENTVFSIEAAPRNIKLIAHNIEQNDLADRITLLPKAAGHKAGSIHFSTGPIEQTGWGGISSEELAGCIQVPIVRLDEELPDSIIDVLKIDVEGADTWVLYGCEKFLKKKQIRMIFFEQNRERMAVLGIGASEAKYFLTSVGYTCTPFGRGEGEWVAYPNDPTNHKLVRRTP